MKKILFLVLPHILLLTGFALSSSKSLAEEPTQTIWSADAIARSNSELSVLSDEQKRPTYTINVYRLKRVLKTLARLQNAAGTKARLWIIHTNDNAPNAFAYVKDDTSNIIITTSILEVLGDDLDAYAFLFGHELGHIVKEHALQRQYLAEMMQFSRTLNPLEFSGRFGREIKGEANLSAALYGAAFGRDQERDADKIGLDFMASANYDQRGALRLHQAIISSSHSERSAFLDNHPSNMERLSYIEKTIIATAANPPSVGQVGRVQAKFSRESNASKFSPGDEELARIAEVMAIIKHEFVSLVDDRQLIAGCRYGLDPQPGMAYNLKAEASLKDIVESISTAKKVHPEISAQEQTDTCLDGMIREVDSRSFRLDKEEVRIKQSPKSVAGIGVELTIQDEAPSVVSVIEGGPAERASLKAGDVLTSIDGVSTAGLSLTKVFDLIRGKEGSSISIIAERPGTVEKLRFELSREAINLISVDSRLLASNYGYIKVRYFEYKTLERLGDALRALEKNGNLLRGIVLDLRDNQGGMLPPVVGVASAFLPENLSVVKTNGKSEASKLHLFSAPHYYVRPGTKNPLENLPQRIKNLPMAVLVNNRTASGAEIVTAALQDHKRAYVIGYRTEGKGSISTIFPLKNNDELRLTTSLFYRPNGDTVTNIGVIPDFTLPASIEESSTTHDLQLEETVKILSERESR